MKTCCADGSALPCDPASTGGGGTGGTTPTAGGGGQGGTGGTVPACTTDADCTDPTKAKCDSDTCVPCDASPQCAGIAGAEVCDTTAGACVQCQLGEEGACDTERGETCDLVAKTCVDVGPESVGNCKACTNDLQCAPGHKCIPMDFPMGTHHGYYCLALPSPGCEDNPFTVAINRPTISGETATNYCGINQDLATCEAVHALMADWRCPSGMDGMCGPQGQSEQPVEGAICRTINMGLQTNRCTYACGGANQCLDPIDNPPAATCGLGTPPGEAPQYCGG